jgi:hypothetical protein
MARPAHGQSPHDQWLAGAAAALCMSLVAPSAWAADFFLYLKCDGKLMAGGKSMPGHVHLALRDNNTSALIQKSNVLPVGQRLHYDVSPQMYSMTYNVRATGNAVLYDWWRGALFVWQPNLKQVTTVRLSIDRQSGGLSGELLNAEASQLGTLAMNCEAINEEDLPAPKF